MSDLARSSLDFTLIATAFACLVVGVVGGFWLSNIFRSEHKE